MDDVTFFELGTEKSVPDWYFLDYCRLMKQLHRADYSPSPDIFKERLGYRSEILQVGRSGATLMACAQASFSLVDPIPKVHIENVVVDERHRGQGHGKVLVQALIRSAKARWSGYGPDGELRLELTNSPTKDNAHFYESLGFTPRTVEAGDPTVVWILVC